MTLIELLIVLLIIATLAAIAVPVFLGARRQAQDRVATSDLRNALAAQKAVFVSQHSYTSDPAVLHAVEPALNWEDIDGTGADVVHVHILPGDTQEQMVCIARHSDSGTWFAIGDVATDLLGHAPEFVGTYYGTFPDGSTVPIDSNCHLGSPVPAPPWSRDASVAW